MGKIFISDFVTFCLHRREPDRQQALESNSGTSKISRKDYFGAFADLSETIKLDSAFFRLREQGVALYHLKNFREQFLTITKPLRSIPMIIIHSAEEDTQFSLQDCIEQLMISRKPLKGTGMIPLLCCQRAGKIPDT